MKCFVHLRRYLSAKDYFEVLRCRLLRLLSNNFKIKIYSACSDPWTGVGLVCPLGDYLCKNANLLEEVNCVCVKCLFHQIMAICYLLCILFFILPPCKVAKPVSTLESLASHHRSRQH